MRRNATWEKKSRRLETFVSWIFFFTANISREEVSYIFGSSMVSFRIIVKKFFLFFSFDMKNVSYRRSNVK